VDAAQYGIAEIVSADVLVLALLGGTGNALSIFATIAQGTGVAVFAGGLVGFVGAPRQRVTAIIGTGIAVVAVGLDTSLTEPGQAAFTDDTEIAVVAGRAFVGRKQFAFAGCCVTGICEAVIVFARVGFAFDNGSLLDLANMRQFGGVAHEGAVASIAIFQGIAVGIHQAVAGEFGSLAFTFDADITGGARVAIIAGSGGKLVVTATGGIAEVLRARVVIVTTYGGAYADSFLAVVSQGTDIAIAAFGAGEWQMDAALLRVTGILGAVVIVTAIEVVYEAIAVIILAVAAFQGRSGRITVAQAIRRALSAPLAGAEFVSSAATGGKPQFHRLF
jgi:hypothetical protein